MSQPKTPGVKHLEYYNNLSANLKYYRSALKKTQEQISETANISAKYLSLLEVSTFKNAPHIETLFRIADALNVKPYQLFEPRRK